MLNEATTITLIIIVQKREAKKDYQALNIVDRVTWDYIAENTECHHRSTIQYCKEIEENPVYSLAFRNFMINDWETSGENYPLIAANEKCAGNAILKTRNYWRMVDSAYGTVMTYFVIIVGFMGLAYLY